MLSLLPMALTECLLEEREVEATLAEVHNDSADPIWIASDSAASDVLVQLGPGEEGVTCLLGAGDVDVYDVDPTVGTPPTPLFVLPFGDRDFCDGTYRWDGSTLDRVE